MGNALKWFSDKRGLAAGLTAAGAGAVATRTVIPVAAAKGAASPMTRRNNGPGEMLKTPVFWMLYIRMVLVASGGLMAVTVTASSDSC
jgi:MFS transporter, OFA family, oxalate/formate antiporter